MYILLRAKFGIFCEHVQKLTMKKIGGPQVFLNVCTQHGANNWAEIKETRRIYTLNSGDVHYLFLLDTSSCYAI